MSDHPSDQALVGWLETGKPVRVSRHLDECERCLDRLDHLTGLEGGVVEHLDAASAPPSDMRRRAAGGAHGRIAAAEAAGAFVDLFSLPWRTASVLMGDGPPRGVIDSSDDPGHHSDDDGEQADE